MTLDARSLMARGGVLDGVSALSAELLRGPRQRRALELDAEKQAEAERRQAVMDLLANNQAKARNELHQLQVEDLRAKRRGREEITYQLDANGNRIGQTKRWIPEPEGAAPAAGTQPAPAPAAVPGEPAPVDAADAPTPDQAPDQAPMHAATMYEQPKALKGFWRWLTGDYSDILPPVPPADPAAALAPVDETPAGSTDPSAAAALIGFDVGAGLPPAGPGGSVAALKGPTRLSPQSLRAPVATAAVPAAAPSRPTVSLAKAMRLPINAGKSRDQIIADIQARGYTAVD